MKNALLTLAVLTLLTAPATAGVTQDQMVEFTQLVEIGALLEAPPLPGQEVQTGAVPVHRFSSYRGSTAWPAP